ncbi:MAG TPA: hypothetical protein VGF67_05905 [Ktedonobacteraceae bacterium]|jgi:hypothetical protein
MKRQVRWFFWLEMGMASITGVLCMVTLVWRDWAEVIFRVDPDQGSGSFEWMIVGVLLLLTLSMCALAGREWRRAALAVN